MPILDAYGDGPSSAGSGSTCVIQRGEYERGDLVQFLSDEGEVLTGMVRYASAEWWCGRWRRWVALIEVTFGGDEWWISPANVVILG